jgi:4-amino-4-deoxy-L-arabinose transferase-like glycosyltransferase
VGIGLAMLSKGPVGAILPFFAVVLYLLAERDFGQLFHPKWFLGIVMVLIIISPSLVHLYKSFGVAGIKFYFITNNFGRISGSYAGSSSDYFFYLHTLLWAFLPWTIIVLAAIFSTVKSWFFKQNENRWTVYLFASVIALVLILSVAKGKAPNYFLIAVSPISVIAAGWLTQFNTFSVNKQRFVLAAQFILTCLNGAFFVFAAFVFSASLVLPIALIAVLSVVTVYAIKTKTQTLRTVILTSTIIAGGFNLFLNAKVLPDLYSYQGARQVLKLFEEKGQPGNRLYNFDIEEYGLFFYARQKVENHNSWDELNKTMEKPGTWLYTNEIKYNDIIKMNYNIDTVYQIRQRGMNRVKLKFLNPDTREESLETNYLIVTGNKSGE